MNTGKKTGGRPRVVTARQIDRLRQAFCWGWPVCGAAKFAGIKLRTYWDFEKKYPDFRTIRQHWQGYPERLARRTVAMGIEAGDVEMSKWFLGRRALDYAINRPVEVEGGIARDAGAIMQALETLLQKSRQQVAGAGGGAAAPSQLSAQ